MDTVFKYNTIAYGLGFPFGSLNDPKGKEGLHHFVEHLIFESKENSEYLQKFQDEGIIYNGATSFEFMLFYTQSIRDKSHLSQQFFEKLLKKFSISEEKFLIERKIISEEISHYLDDKFEFMLAKMLNPKDATVPILGSVKSLNNISLSDIYDVINRLSASAVSVNSDQQFKATQSIGGIDFVSKISYDSDIYLMRDDRITIGTAGYTLKITFEKIDALLMSLSQFLPSIIQKLRSKGLIYSAKIQQINTHSHYALFFQVLIDERHLGETRDTVSQLIKTYAFDFENTEVLMQKSNIQFQLKNDTPIGAMKTVFSSNIQYSNPSPSMTATISLVEGVLVNNGSHVHIKQ